MVKPRSVAAKMLMTSDMLEPSRNWMALRMLPYILRPSSTAPTMVAKLSSARTMSATFLVTSVPVMPMPTPMSALLMLGASLTPSPVMAVTMPARIQAVTMLVLCSGWTLA